MEVKEIAKPPIPANDKERIKALRNYGILDTLIQSEYEDITRLASYICNTDISQITLVDENRTWYKSSFGMEVKEVPREISFCAFAINDPEMITMVPDLREDPRFMNNPYVQEAPNLAFYTGVPLVSPEGHALGAICVVDKKPKALNEFQLETLRVLSRQVIQLFELHKSNAAQERLNREIEDQNKQLRQFATIAAHDIKAPLGNMQMATDLILKEHSQELKKDVLRLLDVVNGSADKLINLVNGILEQSKSTHQLGHEKSHFDVGALIQETTNLLDASNRVKFSWDAGGKIWSNKVALQQILINLATNAIKHNGKKRPTVFIGFKEFTNHYEFEVTDNGPGIAEEDQKRVFDLFETGSNDSRNFQGGVGLATVKKLVEGLGGAITLKSDPLSGTEVRFTIRK